MDRWQERGIYWTERSTALSIVFAELPHNRFHHRRLIQLGRGQFQSSHALVERRIDEGKQLILVHSNRKVLRKFPIPYDRAR